MDKCQESRVFICWGFQVKGTDPFFTFKGYDSIKDIDDIHAQLLNRQSEINTTKFILNIIKGLIVNELEYWFILI